MTRMVRIALEILFIGSATLSLAHAQCVPETTTNPPADICPLPNDPPIVCSNPAPPSCEITGLVFTNATTMTWLAPASCLLSPLLYDVAKGDLDELNKTCEPVSSTCDNCCASCAVPGENLTVTTISDTGTPPDVGHGWWYLVRADDGAGTAGSYNSSSVNQCTDYDPGSAASCLP